MDMRDSRVINAPQAKVWAALNDPAMLKQCIIGCDSLEATETGTFVAAMSVKVGPVSAKFKGKLQLEDVAGQLASPMARRTFRSRRRARQARVSTM